MISLRLSEVEYDVLKTHYRAYGARNVSDLARLALQRIIDGPAASQDGFAAKLADLDGRVQALESRLQTTRVLFGQSPSVVRSEPL
jgi:hypothetical protein